MNKRRFCPVHRVTKWGRTQRGFLWLDGGPPAVFLAEGGKGRFEYPDHKGMRAEGWIDTALGA